MDVKTLREVHKKERMSPYLQEVGKGFYTELSEYLQGLYARYMESSREGDISRLAVLLAELENAKALATEIYETRERKIVNSATTPVMNIRSFLASRNPRQYGGLRRPVQQPGAVYHFVERTGFDPGVIIPCASDKDEL